MLNIVTIRKPCQIRASSITGKRANCYINHSVAPFDKLRAPFSAPLLWGLPESSPCPATRGSTSHRLLRTPSFTNLTIVKLNYNPELVVRQAHHPELGRRIEGWRRERDSNPRSARRTIAFEATAFDHSAISPEKAVYSLRFICRMTFFDPAH